MAVRSSALSACSHCSDPSHYCHACSLPHVDLLFALAANITGSCPECLCHVSFAVLEGISDVVRVLRFDGGMKESWCTLDHV